MIVPMKVNEQVEGMLELASFKPFEPHEIAFVEDLAESFASTLVTVKNSDKMKRLLEESQMKSEQMQAQEEEMRQNMEELTATQEEMKRKQRELEKLKLDLEDKISVKDSSLKELQEQLLTISSLPSIACQRNHLWEFMAFSGNTGLLLGFSEDTFHQKPEHFKSLIYPKDLEAVEQKLALIEQSGKETAAFNCKYRVRHPKKGVRWLLEQGSIEKQEKGYICKSIMVDITDIRPDTSK